MTPADVLALAPAGVHLVARPRGVVHVTTCSSLSPSGRYAPRAAKTVCRTRTGRLHVVEPGRARVCARCSARLAVIPRAAGRAGRAVHRDEYVARYRGLSPFRLYVAAEHASSVAELERAAHASLVALGVAGCRQVVVSPTGAHLGDLATHIGRHRDRVTGRPLRAQAEIRAQRGAEAVQVGKARRREAWAVDRERERQLGINFARPNPTRRPKGAPTP